LELLDEYDRLKAQMNARGALGGITAVNQATRTVIAEETGHVDLNRGAVGGGFPRIGLEAFHNHPAPPDLNWFPHGQPQMPELLLTNRRNPTTPVGQPQQLVQNPLLTPVIATNAWPQAEEVCLIRADCVFNV
jgi:hypothetical protein